MATFKLTTKRGDKFAPKDIVLAAGSTETQTDTMSLNVDYTAWTKGDVLKALDAFKLRIQNAKWPVQ